MFLRTKFVWELYEGETLQNELYFVTTQPIEYGVPPLHADVTQIQSVLESVKNRDNWKREGDTVLKFKPTTTLLFHCSNMDPYYNVVN